MFEAKLYVELSTTHMTKEDTTILDRQDEHSIGYKYPEGYFIPLPDHTEDLASLLVEMSTDGYSMLLRELVRNFSNSGFHMLRLDADGPVDPRFDTRLW